MFALFLSFGIRVKSQLKEGVQADWEAILRPTPQEFIDEVSPWLYPSLSQEAGGDEEAPSVQEHVPALRAEIEAMNAGLE